MSKGFWGGRISERFRQFWFFTKRSTLLLEKSRKINFLHLCKIVTFFVNASRSGEKIKKGTFLEKKGGYFKLSGENNFNVNIVRFSSISHFTKQNFKARRRYLFFSLKRSLQKREKGPFFCGLETFLSKEQKRYLFCIRR